MYATDASNYRQVPIGVVIPKFKAGRDRDDCGLPKISVRRSFRAVAARALPASVATSQWLWTGRNICTISSN